MMEYKADFRVIEGILGFFNSFPASPPITLALETINITLTLYTIRVAGTIFFIFLIFIYSHPSHRSSNLFLHRRCKK